MIIRWISCLLLSACCWCYAGGGAPQHKMHKVFVNVDDEASLQRGARTYMNYCSGCHSLNFMRYSRLAKDIGIVDDLDQVDETLVQNNLIFTDAKPFNTVAMAMPTDKAKHWFGVMPPDLSLIARVRGVDWLYNYLLGFYSDPKRPWGANNLIFPDVGMPNVLQSLQGEQVPHYRTEIRHIDGKDVKIQVIDHLELKSIGRMDSITFDTTVHDLVNFLAYVGEPAQLQRKSIGPWVLGLLLIFTILALLLKFAFWKDVK